VALSQANLSRPSHGPRRRLERHHGTAAPRRRRSEGLGVGTGRVTRHKVTDREVKPGVGVAAWCTVTCGGISKVAPAAEATTVTLP
jgi:hypothetical protein